MAVFDVLIRFAILAVSILLLGVLTGCARPANTATPEGAAPSWQGALHAATPLAALVRERGIAPLDPSRGDLLQQAMRELGKTDPAGRWRGITYGYSRGNLLPPDWLIASPAAWGRRAGEFPVSPWTCKDCDPDFALPACNSDSDCTGGTTCRPLAALGAPARKVCVGHSDVMVDRFYELVAAAEHSVDILTMQPLPDGRFLAALRSALNRLAASGRPIEVRVLVGHYPPEGVDPAALLQALARDLGRMPGARLTLRVAAMRSCVATAACDSWSWNHGKLVAVDGRAAIVGGHNLWQSDYLLERPIFDLSMELRGPAVAQATGFAESLWRYVCAGGGPGGAVAVASLDPGEAKPGKRCAEPRAPLRAAPVAGGSAPVLMVGRLAGGITTDFANQSELARDLLLGAARRSIRLAQQDMALTMGGETQWPESTLESLADALLQHDVEVFIVVSNVGAVGSSRVSYSNGVSAESIVGRLRRTARARSALPDTALDDLLCRRLHVAPFRFGPDATWSANRAIGLHAKLWMVDDRVFYIGSDNVYPADLQELGFIVDDRRAAAELRQKWWDPMWQWSQRAAVSGEGAPRCSLRK